MIFLIITAACRWALAKTPFHIWVTIYPSNHSCSILLIEDLKRREVRKVALSTWASAVKVFSNKVGAHVFSTESCKAVCKVFQSMTSDSDQTFLFGARDMLLVGSGRSSDRTTRTSITRGVGGRLGSIIQKIGRRRRSRRQRIRIVGLFAVIPMPCCYWFVVVNINPVDGGTEVVAHRSDWIFRIRKRIRVQDGGFRGNLFDQTRAAQNRPPGSVEHYLHIHC